MVLKGRVGEKLKVFEDQALAIDGGLKSGLEDKDLEMTETNFKYFLLAQICPAFFTA